MRSLRDEWCICSRLMSGWTPNASGGRAAAYYYLLPNLLPIPIYITLCVFGTAGQGQAACPGNPPSSENEHRPSRSTFDTLSIYHGCHQAVDRKYIGHSGADLPPICHPAMRTPAYRPAPRLSPTCHSRLGCEPSRHLIYIATLSQIPPKLSRLFVPFPRHSTVAVLQAQIRATFAPQDSSENPRTFSSIRVTNRTS